MKSPLQIVETKYPNHKQLLYMLPGPPEFFKNDPFFNHALGHQTVIEFIDTVFDWIGGKPKGFQINQLECSQKKHEADGAEEPITKLVDCCLHIPDLAVNAVFVFKYIHYIKEDTLANTVQSLSSQLDVIESIVSNSAYWKPNSSKLTVTIIVFLCGAFSHRKPELPKKNDKSKEMEIFYQKLDGDIINMSKKYQCLAVSLLRLAKPKSSEIIDDYERETVSDVFTKFRKECDTRENGVENMMSDIVASAPEWKTLNVLQKQLSFKISPAEVIFLDNDGLKKFRDLYFPEWNQKIVTIPDFDRIKTGLLYVTEKDDGRLNETKCNEFIGEMQNFWKDFITKLDSPSGLLLKSFTNNYLSFLLEEDYKENFEIDWLYCSESDIIVIEVGRTIKLEEPTSTMKNKMHQCLHTLIPKMQYVIWYLFKHVARTPGKTGFSEDEEKLQSEMVTFLLNNFKVIIYFPNINERKLDEGLKLVWKGMKTKQLYRIPYFTWKLLYFLVPSDNSPTTNTSLPKLFKLEATPFSATTQSPNLLNIKPTSEGKRFTLKLLDNSVLQSLFGGKKSRNNDNSSSLRHKDITSNIATLFALSFFVNQNLEIEEFAKLPLTTDAKFLDDQQKFIRKEPESQSLHLEQLNITLSPQQHRIMTENRKLLLLVGEPGSGKTVLLLAKAFVEVKDPNAEFIFYYAPSAKRALKADVDKFIQYPKYQDLFSKKFKYLSDKDLFDLSTKSFKDLHKTVLLIDEIYFEAYDEKQRADEITFNQKFLQLSQEVFPFLKNCWMANIVASGLSEDSEIMSKFFNYQFFSIQPLSVQYRSSSHIGTFSTNYLHDSRGIGWSSVRVPGSFVSSQTEVSIHKYSHRQILDLSFFRQDLDYQRWAIVFCEGSEITAWEDEIEKIGKFFQKFVTNSSTGCHECEFSGGESIEVTIFIDHIASEDASKLLPVLNLAITRAQSKLTIYVKEEIFPQLEEFFKLREQNQIQTALMEARAGLPIDFSKIDSEKSPELVNKLYAVAFAKSDRKLILELMKQFKLFKPEAEILIQNLKGWKDKKFLDSLYHMKKIISEFWQRELETLEEASQPSLLMRTIVHAIDISCKPLLEWVSNLMGDENIQRLLRHFRPVVLFQSCFKGSNTIMEYLLKKLTKFDLVVRELESLYTLWGDETTLLTLLCYGNQKTDVVKMILNRGFPDRHLGRSFLGKNALQFAMEHNNVETVKCLLARKDKTSKKPLLLMSSADFCGQTPLEYAKQLGFQEIIDVLSAL